MSDFSCIIFYIINLFILWQLFVFMIFKTCSKYNLRIKAEDMLAQVVDRAAVCQSASPIQESHVFLLISLLMVSQHILMKG